MIICESQFFAVSLQSRILGTTFVMNEYAVPRYNVVAAVIMDQGEVLCVQKPQTRFPYTAFHWEYPGGKVESGETEEQALVRELREEMDYPIMAVRPLCVVTHCYPDFEVCLHFWLCRPTDVTHPRRFVLKEHVACCWRRPDCLEDLLWCEADNDAELHRVMQDLCEE